MDASKNPSLLISNLMMVGAIVVVIIISMSLVPVSISSFELSPLHPATGVLDGCIKNNLLCRATTTTTGSNAYQTKLTTIRGRMRLQCQQLPLQEQHALFLSSENNIGNADINNNNNNNLPPQIRSGVAYVQQRQQYKKEYDMHALSFSSSSLLSPSPLKIGNSSSNSMPAQVISRRRSNTHIKNRWSFYLSPTKSSSTSSLSSTSEGSDFMEDNEEKGEIQHDLGTLASSSSSSSDIGNERKEEEAGKQNNLDDNVGYDDLYEFLTRRTGERAGESERKRKRNRIMQWMEGSKSNIRSRRIADGNDDDDGTSLGGNSSGASSASSDLIQPIRLEDGRVDEELVAEQELGEQQGRISSRTKLKFDQLFSGMPTLDEIISRDSTPTTDTTETIVDSETTERRSDFSWFEPERLRIVGEYDQIRQDMKVRIREQRLLLNKSDQEGNEKNGDDSTNNEIPENAEGIADAIILQEMKQMIESVKVQRSKERLHDYESERSSNVQSRDYENVSDKVVDKILKETADQQERKKKLNDSAAQYLEYEESLRKQQRYHDAGPHDIAIPGEDTNLDDWSLQRMEEMLEKSQNRKDDDGTLTDILEENIDNLRQQIKKESKKSSPEIKTMKEWQMYRSIATRLAKAQQNQGHDDSADNNNDRDVIKVEQQLNSWREYIEKEDGMRQRSGLSSTPKLPFAHLGTKMDQIDEGSIFEAISSSDDEKKSRREFSREVNIQAVQAMEALISKSDNKRAGILRKQLDIIKADLEARDYHDTEEDIEDIVEDPVPVGPVDLTDVFVREEEEKKEQDKPPVNDVSYPPASPSTARIVAYDNPDQPNVPDTPFFSNPPGKKYKSSVPNTPFFQDSNERDGKDELNIESKLGSIDEQKLQAMFRKANARTKKEQDAIRQEWESFQEFEKKSRDISGLSKDTDDSTTLTDNVELKYDVEDVMTGDGDFDADKILSTIGKRPVRNKKADATVTKSRSDVDPSKVSDAMYRSVAAARGGRGSEDEEFEEKNRAEYDDYLAKEEEMRRNLDTIKEGIIEDFNVADVDVDDPKYVENVLGPRPVVKIKKRKVLTERELSDMGGIRSSENDDDDDDDDDYDDQDQDDTLNNLSSIDESFDTANDFGFNDNAPKWLKKERKAAAKSRDNGRGEFLGSDINEVFDDDKYEQNLREVREYEQRRSGERNQVGIDVSEILGRRASDNYDDYMYDSTYRDRQDEWGETSFRARKANLLQYVELDPSEINSLIAHKVSLDSSAVSQYLPRINKPFKEFGAIFRLEGVLIDMTGLQQKVWKRVATDFKFEEPSIEQIKRVAALEPNSAVRELFYTAIDDFVLMRRIGDVYRQFFREEFNLWAMDYRVDKICNDEPSVSDNVTTVTNTIDSLVIGYREEKETSEQETTPTISSLNDESNEDNKLSKLKEVWLKTSEQFGYLSPTDNQITESSMLSPDIAVRSVFRWSQDEKEIEKIIAAYSMVQGGGFFITEKDPSQSPSVIPTTESKPIKLAEADAVADIVEQVSDMPTAKPMMPIESEMVSRQFEAWKITAKEHDFDVPLFEEIQALVNIRPQDAVRQIMIRYVNVYELTPEEATEFEMVIEEIIDTYITALSGNDLTEETQAEKEEIKHVTETSPANPLISPQAEMLLLRQIEAWAETANVYDFDAPSLEQIQSVVNMSPRDAVRQVMLAYVDFYELTPEDITEFDLLTEEILETYTVSLKSISKMYMDNETKESDFQDDSGLHLDSDNDDISESVDITTADSVQLVTVMPDINDWIKSLHEVEMGCGVVTYLEDDQMNMLIEFAGLSDIIPKDNRVSYSNGYFPESQQLLGASLRIERPPDLCVVFDTSPSASLAAQEFEMKSVAMVGNFPKYELLAADISTSSVKELTAMNIRRLFGEKIYDQPDVELDMRNRQPNIKRRVKTKYKWEGDE